MLIFKILWLKYFINDFIICLIFNLIDVESIGVYEFDLIMLLFRWVCFMYVFVGILKLKVVEIGWDVVIKFFCWFLIDIWICRYI